MGTSRRARENNDDQAKPSTRAEHLTAYVLAAKARAKAYEDRPDPEPCPCGRTGCLPGHEFVVPNPNHPRWQR